MSLILRKRKNTIGSTSLRFDIYKDSKHTIETLKHLRLAKPLNLQDQESNKSLMQQAEPIRISRAVELEGKNYNMDNEAAKKHLLLSGCETILMVIPKKIRGICKVF